jgi:hypothetical protein
MKKFFTLLCGAMFVMTAIAQPPKTVLYLADEMPFATGEGRHNQEMFDIISGLGYNVTAEAITAGGTTTGYDCIFASESPGSSSPGWPTYKEAPLPMVMGKVWAAKGPALGWFAGENSGTDYGNSIDSIFIKVEDHEILTGLDDEFGIVNGGSTEGAIGAFVNFTLVEDPAGVTVICKSEGTEGKPDEEHTVVTVDKGSTLNGVTLANDVVILGIHQVVYDELNSNAIKLIDNCLKWAMGIPIGELGIEDESAELEINVYPNPSNTGMVNINFNQYVASAEVNILSLDGRTVRTDNIYNLESMNLDLSDLNSGIYILNITGTDITFTQSISIQY